MFSQFVIALVCTYHVINYQWLPVFQRVLNETERTFESMLINIYDLMLPGVLIIIIGAIFLSSVFCTKTTFVFLQGFYGFFHCWLNTFAEIFRFADRMFYEVKEQKTSRSTLRKTFFDRSFRTGGT